MSNRETQRFTVVLATDGQLEVSEIVDVLDALGYRGIVVLDEDVVSEHEHPCPSRWCVDKLRHEGHDIPEAADCCVCWAANRVA